MKISDLINNPNKLNKVFKKALNEGDKEVADLLVEYIDDPELVYRYAKEIVHGKVSDKLEDVIAKDPNYSFWYAKDVLKGPFPKGEEVIATNSWYSYAYAKDVLKGSFPKGEDAIATNAIDSYFYAKNVLKGRFEKGEDAIASDYGKSSEYASFLADLKIPIPEKIIKSTALNSNNSYNVARHLLLNDQDVPEILLNKIAEKKGYRLDLALLMKDAGKEIPEILIKNFDDEEKEKFEELMSNEEKFRKYIDYLNEKLSFTELGN